MIRHLLIRNYALIDELEIDFQPGLTTITGETGAGKSILLGALSLILGQRADTKALQDRERKCIIEGTFDVSRYGVKPFFEKHDLDYDDHTQLRREITPSGKSRAFINDTPASLAQVKELGNRLVDIHSQHQSLRLNRSDFQLSVMDAVAGHSDQLKSYGWLYRQYQQQQTILADLEAREAQAKRDQDYLRFQFEELENAALQSDEQEGLEKELHLLENAESIKSNLFAAAQGLASDETNVNDLIHRIRSLVDQVADFHPDIPALAERIRSTAIELEDITQELEGIEDSIQYDPERVEVVTGRLDLINRLEQKHSVSSIGELLTLQQDLDRQLQDIGSLESEIEAARELLGKQRKQLEQQAQILTDGRLKAANPIEQQTGDLLAGLGIPDGKLVVSIEKTDALQPTGWDKARFLFTANEGEVPRPLTEVASGGEISRLMLAIKSIVAQHTDLPTILFDEIDTGVSGPVADQVGDILQAMGQTMQVVSITHLPQIAVKGAQHWKVRKETHEGVTHSRIAILSHDERVTEVARLLSGRETTEAALRNARELLAT